MKVLQICHKMPNPPCDGGAQAIHNTTRGLLKNDIDVNVIAINPSRNFININVLSSEYLIATKFETVFVDTGIKPLKALLNLFTKDSYFVERFKSKAFETKIIEVLAQKSFDIIQLEHLYLFLYVDVIKKHSNAKIVFRPQNIEYVIWKRYQNNINNPFKRLFIKVATKRLERFEKRESNNADAIIALTKDDASIFKTFVQNIPIVDIPMGFDFGNLINYNFEKQYEEFPIFYHLGSMDWLPNEEAMRWFVDKVYNLVIEKIPDVRIHIAGRNMQDYFFKKRSINLIIEGEIQKPIDYQEDKAIMIVPLLSGSGIRAKIVEGIALGKTIITTTIGAQGINYKNGENLLISDTPIEFAEQMLKCYQSKEYCKRIGNNARKLSKSKYHYISTAKEIVEFYKKLITKDAV